MTIGHAQLPVPDISAARRQREPARLSQIAALELHAERGNTRRQAPANYTRPLGAPSPSARAHHFRRKAARAADGTLLR
jgi:hypothetical protein